jgi:hypothetical protein
MRIKMSPVDPSNLLKTSPGFFSMALEVATGLLSTAAFVYIGWNAAIPSIVGPGHELKFLAAWGIALMLYAIRMGVMGLGASLKAGENQTTALSITLPPKNEDDTSK